MRFFTLKILLFLFLNQLVAQAESEQMPRYKIAINSNWSFVKGEKPSEEDVNWEHVELPHSWNIADPFDEERGYYRGVGWYRKVINTDALPPNEKAFIYFEAANQYAQVFVNGIKVGEHKGGYTAFCFDISRQLKEGENVLEVRLDNSHDPAVPPLKGDFNFYGGIYRDVYLILTNDIHFDLLDHASPGVYITTPVVDSAKARIRLDGNIINEGTETEPVELTMLIYDQAGKRLNNFERGLELVPGSNTFEWEVTFNDPLLWSPDMPNLYNVVLQVQRKADGQVLDELTQPLAFRWFEFDANEGFFLNGQPLKLIGVNRHQDLPGKANALSNAEHRHDMELIKSTGSNFFRTGHYPQDPAILEACDRLGMLVTMEIPLDHEITDSPAFYANCKTMMREMIRQYHNHPSIIIWAYMNEMFLGRNLERDKDWIEKIVAFARELEQLTRKEDPTRYTMIPNHGDFKVYHESGMTRIPMIVGWNLYYGWYEPTFEGFGSFIDKAHRELPDKALIVTEYGAGADPRLRSSEPLRFDFSVDWETTFHQEHLKQITARPFLAGATVWNMFDFGSTNRQDAVPHVNNKGLSSFDRKPKDPFFVYQAWLSDEPVLKLTPVGWKHRAGVQNDKAMVCNQIVRAFGNVPEAELLHNGQSLGTKKLEAHTALWEVPFTDGANSLVLRAIGERAAIQDDQQVMFSILPKQTLAGQASLRLNLGTSLSFQDADGQQFWLPEKEASDDTWGVIGGQRYMPRNRGVGGDRDILGTEKDPLYQTQRIGVERLIFPLSNGTYRVTVHFAELEGKEPGDRVFSLLANGVILHPNLDIARDYGNNRAVALSYNIRLEKSELILEFIPRQGEPFINAIQIQKTVH